MRFGYTILYVEDVPATLDFYERAFGQRRRFLHDSGEYAELDTAGVTLAFASRSLAADNLGEAYEAPAGGSAFEVCFVSQDVATAFAGAVTAGAEAVREPQRKPWGQDVAYVRDPNGVLIELASPVTS